MLGAPLFLPLLIASPFVARRRPALESWRGIVTGTGACAALAGVLYFVWLSFDQRPLAPHGLALMPDTLGIVLGAWLALMLPRVIIRPLRAGAMLDESAPS